MRTLLIADDHPSVLRALEFVLAGTELRIVLAESGNAALACGEHEAFDAALVDLHMPAMDGLALTRALKAQAAKSGRALPVWVMTAAHTAAAAEQARAAGAQGLLKKPFDCEGLRAELARVLNPDAAPATFAA
jgi:CheY-like chemotaxis protein